MIKVHHANRNILRDSLCFGLADDATVESLAAHFDNGQYDLAGEVSSIDLCDAYRNSQNGASGWGDGKQRSTSVGDILETDHYLYLVSPEGFTLMKVK